LASIQRPTSPSPRCRAARAPGRWCRPALPGDRSLVETGARMARGMSLGGRWRTGSYSASRGCWST
jgi:hypothetical protein